MGASLHLARTTRVVAWAMTLALAACAFTPEPEPNLLALPAVQVPATLDGSVAGQAKPHALAIRRVIVPEYLQARAVRYRADDATLAAWPQTIWAERIEIAVTRNIVTSLQKQLPSWAVCDGLCAGRDAQPVLTLEFTQADLLRGARLVRAQARWTMTSANGLTVMAQGSANFDEPLSADTPSAHAQALARLLERVAQTLAQAIQK